MHDWSFMNLSVNAALNSFGEVAADACKDELVQLFIEKEALIPVKLESLSEEQRERVVRSHVFFREKYQDGSFFENESLAGRRRAYVGLYRL
jgi:hypothetical protein